jgi:pSer/pThr/pTyr-binding forkhead associated (FHA) protein
MEDLMKPRDGLRESDDAVMPMKLVLQPSGMAVELTKAETVVGRHMSCDLRLPLPDVSRRHCRFVFVDRCWQVFDLNSLNGIFVNGERVTHSVLHNGDAVRLGSFTFNVEMQPATVPLNAASNRVLKSIADVLETQQAPPKRQAS